MKHFVFALNQWVIFMEKKDTDIASISNTMPCNVEGLVTL